MRQRTERALSSLALPHHVQPGASTCTFAIRDLADRASALPRFFRVERGAGVTPHALQRRPSSPHSVRRQRSSPRTPPRGLPWLLCSSPEVSTVLASRHDQARPSHEHHAGSATRFMGNSRGPRSRDGRATGGEPALTTPRLISRKFAVSRDRSQPSAGCGPS